MWRNRWVRGAVTAGESLAEETAAEAGVADTLPSRFQPIPPVRFAPEEDKCRVRFHFLDEVRTIFSCSRAAAPRGPTED